MAEIRTKEGLIVGLIKPTTDTSQDKKETEQKPQETTNQRSTRRKQHDAE